MSYSGTSSKSKQTVIYRNYCNIACWFFCLSACACSGVTS